MHGLKQFLSQILYRLVNVFSAGLFNRLPRSALILQFGFFTRHIQFHTKTRSTCFEKCTLTLTQVFLIRLYGAFVYKTVGIVIVEERARVLRVLELRFHAVITSAVANPVPCRVLRAHNLDLNAAEFRERIVL